MAKDEDEIIDELNEDSPKKRPSDEDEDQVTAAYETINKRLEGLKKGSSVGDEDDKDSEDSDESKGSEEDDEKESDEDEDDDDNDEDDNEEEKSDDERPGDILDEEESGEDEDDGEGSKGSEETEGSEDDEDEVEPVKSVEPVESEDTGNTDNTDPTKNTGPDEPETLDDLTKENKEELDQKEYNRPTRRFDDLEESNFDIPNLKRPMNENSFGDNQFSDEPKPNPFSSRMDSNRDFGSYGQKRSGNKIHLLILILIGLAVIGGTVYLLKNQFEGGTVTEPSPTPIAISSPTPEPTPSFDRSKYKLRLLNGTTTSGLAGSVSAKLKELGYQIEKTGNAPNQKFKKTEIKVKSQATGLSDQLIKDLPSEYSDASPAGELKDSDPADAEIILGAQ